MRTYLVFSRRTLIGLALAIIVSLAVGWAVLWSYLSISALKYRQIDTAGAAAEKALWVVQPAAILTFHSLPDLEVWKGILEEIVIVTELKQTALPFAHQLFTTPDQTNTSLKSSHLVDLADQLYTTTQSLENVLPRSIIGKKFVQPKLKQFSTQSPSRSLTSLTQDFKQIVHTLTSEHQKILLLFQNSDEIRATGGFMGSYALLDLQDGQLQTMEIQDIYEPDGQFQGFIEAPPGLEEYVSSGHGLRLPDANWWPHFPTSAQSILHFFALGRKEQIDHVVALNLSVAQDLLRITGDVYLPDYKMIVTAENLPLVARSEREHFFPGSQQKRNFLAALFTQLKLKLSDLDSHQQLAVAQLFWQKLQTKDIQLYSNQDELEDIWSKHEVGGEVKTGKTSTSNTQPSFSLFSVESNVGINKANKAVNREVAVIKKGSTTTVTLTFHNRNLIDELEPPVPPLKEGRPLMYVNYQRLLVPPSVKQVSVRVDGQPITPFREDTVQTEKGPFKEIGFLVTVPVQQTVTVSVQFQLPGEVAAQDSLFLQKQSGLLPVPYHLEWDGVTKDILLKKDEMITF